MLLSLRENNNELNSYINESDKQREENNSVNSDNK